VRRGAIRIALKLPSGELRRVDPDLRTVPIHTGGHWKPFPRAFDLRDPVDVPFVADLILACKARLVPKERRLPRGLPHDESVPSLAFVRDPRLREILYSDWQETQRAFGAAAWKSTVILCGGLVEGLLVDALGRDVRAREFYVLRSGETHVPGLDRWPFDARVRVAQRLGALSFDMAVRCQELCSRRNLVHPSVAARIQVTATKEVAADAWAILCECQRELQARYEGTTPATSQP
jgi:hypothetical protein